MTGAVDTSSLQFLLECEARSWLRQGYDTADKVGQLIDRIEKRRGQAAALELQQEMRRQWACRHEWLEPSSE